MNAIICCTVLLFLFSFSVAELFFSNVLEELVREIDVLATDKHTSFIVQKLIVLANEQQVEQLLKSLLKNLEV